MLAISLIATLSANIFINAVAFLIPAMSKQRGIGLAQAGLLASMPNLGMVLTLILRGYLLDRVGERIVLATGLALTAIASAAAASANSMIAMGVYLFRRGRYWSGRALGTQNTVERLMVAVGPPVFGDLISASGYPLAFAVCGLFPLAALPLLPVTAHHSDSSTTPL